jgi:hypothetical protein
MQIIGLPESQPLLTIFKAGLAASAPAAYSGGVIADLFVERERASVMALFSLEPLGGGLEGGSSSDPGEGEREIDPTFEMWIVAVAGTSVYVQGGEGAGRSVAMRSGWVYVGVWAVGTDTVASMGAGGSLGALDSFPFLIFFFFLLAKFPPFQLFSHCLQSEAKTTFISSPSAIPYLHQISFHEHAHTQLDLLVCLVLDELNPQCDPCRHVNL